MTHNEIDLFDGIVMLCFRGIFTAAPCEKIKAM